MVHFSQRDARVVGLRLGVDLSEDDLFDLSSSLAVVLRGALPEKTVRLSVEAVGERTLIFDFHGETPSLDDAYGGRTFRDEDYRAFDAEVRRWIGANAVLQSEPIVRVSRVAPLDWNAFRAETWSALDQAYRGTLGWMGAEGLARWFGRSDDDIPHLSGSVEPVGVQIDGVIEEALLLAWERSFLQAIEGFPMR